MIPSPSKTPSELIALAISEGASPDALSKLMDLQERWNKQRAESAFNHAMQEFQSRCPSIIKNATAKIETRKGGSYSYSFATLDHIWETIRPLMAEVGLNIRFTVPRIEGNLMSLDCVLTHVDGHREISTFQAPIEIETGMSGPQKYGSAVTFCRRYAMTMVLGLCTADPDTDAARKGKRIRSENPVSSGLNIDDQGVTVNKLKELRSEWNSRNPDDANDRGAFLAWCSSVTQVKMNVLDQPEGWKLVDLQACWAELER